MNHDTISLRRRHLMIAGLAGVAAPAIGFAARSGGAPEGTIVARHVAGEQKLVVSGRILRSDGTPLAGGRVEIQRAGTAGESIVAGTDADGRFMFTTTAYAEATGRLRHLDCRISHQGQERLATRLHFAGDRSVAGERIAQLLRDGAGVWRASFGLTLA